MRNTLDIQRADSFQGTDTAYIIGVSLGDGNLSRPNRRVTRLRVTCDGRYPGIAAEIIATLQRIFPKNKVSIARRKKNTCFDVSVYSNKLDEYLPWKVGQGSKFTQTAHVPKWIFSNKLFIKACLKGLLQTDGSIYSDRGYLMINFVNNIPELAADTQIMMGLLGYHPRLYTSPQKSGRPKYTVRPATNVAQFTEKLGITKS